MGLFKGDVPVFARLWPVRVRVGVSFTTGAVWLAILATAGLLVFSSVDLSLSYHQLAHMYSNKTIDCVCVFEGGA